MSEVRIEGYSDASGGNIVYRATHLRTGVSVIKVAPPHIHCGANFEFNKAKLLTDLGLALAKRRQADLQAGA